MTIAAVVLAAGRGSRMGGGKMLAEVSGRPLAALAAEAALAAGLDPVVVVTGCQAEAVEAALPRGVRVVRNPDYQAGMGGSLACGVAALPPVEGVAVMLADMPRVGPGHLRRLVEGFDGGIRVPVFAGRRGNPVVFGRAHFGELAALTGESGGKALLARHPVTEVAMEDGAVLFDVDTPLDHIRARFPALGGGRHLLDNAAMAQMPDIAIEAMRIHDSSARANVRRGLHDPARDADIAFEAARAVVARFLSADPAEVVFTGGCTAALNLAAAALTDTLAPGDEVVVSLLEHHSNLLPWLAAARRKGLVVRRIPVTADGRLDAAPIGPRTRVVAVTLASNVTGAVTGLPAIAKAAHDVGAVVVADAAQLVPHGPLDAAATGADLLAFSGHKAFGPTGIGVLWGRRALLERLEPPWTGGGMVAGIDGDDFQCLPPPARFEAGTPPVTQAIGLAAALDWLMTLDWNAIAAHEAALAARLLDGLAARPEISLVGPRTARLPLVSFTAAGAHPHDIAQLLADRGIAVRAGHHCARPLADALGLAEGCVRASLALYNDAADVDALLAGLDAALEALR